MTVSLVGPVTLTCYACTPPRQIIVPVEQDTEATYEDGQLRCHVDHRWLAEHAKTHAETKD